MKTRQQLIEFLDAKQRRVHFVGVGGCGMSGLAKILLQQGHHVTGSDLSPNGETDRLRALGAKVFSGHAARHVTPDTDLVVFTSAVHGENEELNAAEELKIPTVRRGLLLTALMNHQNNIAVAGTHGKTTTTSMIAHVLTRSDSAPSFCVGAHVPVLGTNAQIGGGKYFVAEADESDGTLIGFTPEFAVCLNIEPEHLDFHGSMDRLLATFESFVSSTLRSVFYCADCPACGRRRHRRSQRLRASSDGSARDDRRRADARAEAARRGVSTAPVHADSGVALRIRNSLCRRGQTVFDRHLCCERTTHRRRERLHDL